MKKAIQLLLAMVLVVGSVSQSFVIGYSQEDDGKKLNKAYYEFLDNLIYGDQNSDGIGIYSSKSSDPLNENVKTDKGVIYVGLGDLDNDESKDLVCLSLKGDGNYTLEAYNFKNNKMNEIFTIRQPLNIANSDSNSISTIHVGVKTFIGTYEYTKKDLGFDEIYKFYSYEGKDVEVDTLEVNCNLTQEQQKQIAEGKADESKFYTYKQTKQNSTKELKKKKFDEIIDNYQSGETFLMENSLGSFYSQLDLSRNNDKVNSFFNDLLIESMPKYSFETMTDILSEDSKLNKLLTTFVKDFVRYNNYDSKNVNKGELLEFVFNSYEFDTKKSSDKDIFSKTLVEGSNSIEYKLKYSEAKEFISKIFGVELNMKDGEAISINNGENTDTFSLNGDYITKSSIDRDDRKKVVYKPQIRKAYEVEKGCYYLELVERKSVSGNLETLPNVYFAIVEKSDSKDFKMLRISEKPFKNEDEIRSYAEKKVNNSILKSKKVQLAIIGVVSIVILLIAYLVVRRK